MSRGSFMTVLLTAAVCPASGCDSTISPIQVAPGCPDRPLRDPEKWAASAPATQLIDDFESADGRLAREENRNGQWVLSTDATAGASTAGTSSLCVANGAYAGHFVPVASADWGAMWSANFRAPAVSGAQPYDGSKYGGLSFWAAFDAANGPPFSIRVGLVTVDTAWNGGVCSTYCMDFHGIDVTPGTAWQRFEIRFDDLRQQGWGDVQAPLRRDQLVGFVVWPNRKADLWLDELRFEL
jgi:hypothetical protein